MAKRKATVTTCDNLFRVYIKARDKSCQRCHTTMGKLETAHFYSRAYRNIRFEPDNACLLCFKCHYLFAHREPLEFAEFWKKRLGEERMNLLTLKKNTYKKMDYGMEKAILKKLIEELK